MHLKNKQKHLELFDYINYSAMILLIVVMLYPIIYVLSVSISAPEHVIRNSITFLPKGFSLDAYITVFKEPMLIRSYLNTILYATIGTVITVFITLITAYPLTVRSYVARGFLVKFYTVTMFFNGGMVPTFLLINNLRLMDSIWALVLPGAITLWNIMVTRSFLQEIPFELQESAHIDGANEIRIFFNIILPLSKPIIATLSLFTAVGQWNSYFAPMIYLNTREKWPLSLILRRILLNAEFSMNLDFAIENFGRIPSQSFRAAIIIVTIIPILCIYPFVQKYFVKGVMVGSLKA